MADGDDRRRGVCRPYTGRQLKIVMTEFDRARFEHADDPARTGLRARLSTLVSERLRGAPNFREMVSTLVSELRAQGHDMWSWDEDDDFAVWGPNYSKPSGPGIVVTFRAHDESTVDWWEPRREVTRN